MLDVLQQIAEAVAKRSTCSTRAAVGAVLFDEQNRIVATGYNGSPRHMPHCDEVGCNLDADGHCKNAVHAEVNAIIQCAVLGRSTQGLRLMCTHSPCIRCANIIIQAGIARVYFIQYYMSDFPSTAYALDSAGVRWEQFREHQ